MKRWQTFKPDESVICFRCGRDIHPARNGIASDYPVGTLQQYCIYCEMWTFYDINSGGLATDDD